MLQHLLPVYEGLHFRADNARGVIASIQETEPSFGQHTSYKITVRWLDSSYKDQTYTVFDLQYFFRHCTFQRNRPLTEYGTDE